MIVQLDDLRRFMSSEKFVIIVLVNLPDLKCLACKKRRFNFIRQSESGNAIWENIGRFVGWNQQTNESCSINSSDTVEKFNSIPLNSSLGLLSPPNIVESSPGERKRIRSLREIVFQVPTESMTPSFS
ncbi:hypothetical protein HK096_001390, partial [Nowakowskiella sp. JEL0078]